MAHPPLSLSQLLNQWADPWMDREDRTQVDGAWLTGFGVSSPAFPLPASHPPQDQPPKAQLPKAQPLEAQAQIRLRAEQEWLGGIAALAQLLTIQPSRLARLEAQSPLGVVMSGPFPVLPDCLGGQLLHHWLLVPDPLERILAVARPQLPGQQRGRLEGGTCDLPMVPLAPEDPLAQERFCLLLTANFSLVLVLGEGEQGQPRFRFSFDPVLAEQTWQQLRMRILQARPALLPTIDSLVAQFPPVTPDFRLVTQYSHLLLDRLRHQTKSPGPVTLAAVETISSSGGFPNPQPLTFLGPASTAEGIPDVADESAQPSHTGSDTELLKAMAHEIRTPLTTIRTLTRSLLKRKDITEEVAKRLRSIDRECTQQIDRFNLIFRAVELETEAHQQPKSPLSAFPLDQLFQEAIPLWQQQASRRNHTLTVTLPPQLPLVNSDPTMLNQVLSGLIDRFTHSLPPYSHIELSVTLAGHQLKLQFQSQPPDPSPHPPDIKDASPNADTLFTSPFKALGQLLIFQPETGGLSLNIHATKNLFQSLGGKLIVRQRPQTGEVLTVFLPLETRTL